MTIDNYIPINLTENEINIILNGMDLLLMNKKRIKSKRIFNRLLPTHL